MYSIKITVFQLSAYPEEAHIRVRVLRNVDELCTILNDVTTREKNAHNS
jgi:hypothetical protein